MQHSPLTWHQRRASQFACGRVDVTHWWFPSVSRSTPSQKHTENKTRHFFRKLETDQNRKNIHGKKCKQSQFPSRGQKNALKVVWNSAPPSFRCALASPSGIAPSEMFRYVSRGVGAAKFYPQLRSGCHGDVASIASTLQFGWPMKRSRSAREGL